MSKEVELRTLSKLEGGEQLPWTSVPTSVRKGITLRELLATNILAKIKRGAGSVLTVVAPEDLRQFLDARFPGRHTATSGSGVTNQHRYRDSKGATKSSIGVLLLRGQATITVNEQRVDLSVYTKRFACFSAVKPRLRLAKLCLVENLDCFMRAEEVLGPSWTFAHTYGRLGSDSLTGLAAEELLHFGDWDYTGLDEYLRLRENFPQARLYVPDQLEELWQSRSTPLKVDAIPTQRLRQSNEPTVAPILKLLGKTHRFLEQQAVFSAQNPAL